MSITKFYRPTWVEIDLDAIAYNVLNTKKLMANHQKLIAVVKANAYGHGAVPVAKTALDNGANILAVALLEEALELRESGIIAPILVLGIVPAKFSHIGARHNISFTVDSVEWIKEATPVLKKHDLKLSIHLKIDSGMGRLGLRSLDDFKSLLLKLPSSQVYLEGIFTHFASADSSKISVHNQLSIFKKFLNILKQNLFEHVLVHSCNSAGIFLETCETHDAVRLGISLYGISPYKSSFATMPFAPRQALSIHSRFTNIKKVSKGSSIGYGSDYISQKDEWIGTLPIGYADGLTRSLVNSNILVEGKKAQLIGSICMDQCIVRLPNEISRNCIATIIGKNGNQEITVEQVAKFTNTIPYEVLCRISNRIPRTYKTNKCCTSLT